MNWKKIRSKRFPRTGRFASRRSFNLVELSLAVAVVAVGVVSVFGILPHLLQSSRQASEFSAIALDVQLFMENETHRGMISIADLENTAYFPTVAIPSSQNVRSASFNAQRSISSWPATNAAYSMDNDPPGALPWTNYYGNTALPQRPILNTVFITYRWGNTNSPTDAQTFTFITEAAATEGFLTP